MHTRERVVLMTVRVTTLKGVDAGAYYVENLGRYYLEQGEPLGRWHGRGAAALGLAGDVDERAFLALMAGRHPQTGKSLGRRYGAASVRGFDATASAPKSVSVLFALGDEDTRRAVVDAHDGAVAAMVGWIEGHAHTRYRVGGEVMCFDAEGIVAATFRQHTSRALDPQLHTHVVIPNRVLSPDGRWLSLDARSIKWDQRTLSALYHATLRAELTRTLGVAWHEPVHGIAEMRHFPDAVLEEFSARTRAVAERIEVKLERFEDSLGRSPTARERWRLEREAVTESRSSKPHGVDAAALHAEWALRSEALGHSPARVVDDALDRAEAHGLDDVAEATAVTRALAALGESQSTWRPAEVVRELATALPTEVAERPEVVVAWLDDVAARAAEDQMLALSPPVPPHEPRRRDGRPITESVADHALTTPSILAQEEALVAWAERRLAVGGIDVAVDAPGLSGPQREVACALAGTRELVLVVGAAGTGKTSAIAPGVESLRAEGRAVFGVAPSAAAAEVLGAEAALASDTVDKLLAEHRLSRPPDHRYDLPAGTTVVVDEAAMVSTPNLAELAGLAERRGWRLALVGDPLQFSAVERSGMFAHLVSASGAIELDGVRRFAHEWEREASLCLRRGDAGVLDLYESHGRIHGGSRRRMQRHIVEAWWAARCRGERVAMMAPTTETVVGLNLRAQALRAQEGELDVARGSVSAGPYRLHVGDVVATRRNDRELRTERGLMVKNRDQWEVLGIHADGGLSVAGRSGTVRLPGAYVAEHVELAYAQTSHATQGRTVDRSLLLLDGPTDARGVYVPMTRGRGSNEAFVVLDDERTGRDVLADALARDWIDTPAVERREELRRRAPEPTDDRLDPARLRLVLDHEHEIARALVRAEEPRRLCGEALDRAMWERAEVAARVASATQRWEKACDTLDRLDTPIGRRLHRQEFRDARQEHAQARVAVGAATERLADIDGRLEGLRASVAEAHAASAECPRLERERQGLRRLLDRDLASRSRAMGADPPDHVIERLGPRPGRDGARGLWDEAAGRLVQYREAFSADGGGHASVPWWDDTPADATARAAEQACARLDRAVGRVRSVEPPHIELGISL